MAKGIVLAGGTGTRLSPLTNKLQSKQLLPVYDKPMIFYPIETLRSIGIVDILIITTLHEAERFEEFLGDGSRFGVNLTYKIQPKPAGIADAFNVGREFVDGDNVALILGDNIYVGDIQATIGCAPGKFDLPGATLFAAEVDHPERYGVFKYTDNKLDCVIEKPTTYVSNLAATGLYVFDHTVARRVKKLVPSARGELEIVDIINQYISEGEATVINISDNVAWFDCGDVDELNECSNYVRAIQNRTNRVVGLNEG